MNVLRFILYSIVALTIGNSFAIARSPLTAQTESNREALTFPILFCQRHNYQGLHIYDTFYQWRRGVATPGTSGIYVLENPADPPEKRRIRPVIDPTTQPTLGDGNYFDPALSYDAQTILFCYKDSPNGNSIIYRINVDGSELQQITNLDAQGAPYKGSGAGHHDVKPAWLPDGRIVFTSTRYSGLVPCANNGVAILHVCNADGTDIHTISVNNVTDFDPSVLPDGRILFGRWEYIDKNALTIQSLWSIYPDGTNETAYFANNMVFPEAVLQARVVPGADNLVVAAFAPHNAPPRGSIAMIDITAGKQNSMAGKNDVKAIFNFEHPDSPTYDRGQSCDPFALNENVVLYSGQIPNPVNGGKFNSIALIDRTGKRVEIFSNPTIDVHNPIPLVPQPLPMILADQTDRLQTKGAFYVTDVYEGMPDVKRGTAKWLRVVEETSRVSASPGSNGLNQTFSISAALAWSAKIYHGIVPVEPDGSAYFTAPSGRALYFQLLDEDYRLIRSMRTFVQAAQGTVRSCTGCHEYGPPKGAARQTNLAGKRPQELKPESWGTGYMDYPSMIQPIFDRKCVACHGGSEGIAAGLDLSNGPTELFNISYVNLTSRREKQYWADLIAGVCCMNGTAWFSCKIFKPYEHGSGAAPLAERLLKDETHKKLLTKEEKELLFTWIDSNGLYFGTWNYTGAGPFLSSWTQAREQLKQVMRDNQCVECHADSTGNIVRFENDWINLSEPQMSRILRAPLPPSNKAPYGIGSCRAEKVDSTYRRLGIMSSGRYEHAVQPLDAFPTQTWRPAADKNDLPQTPPVWTDEQNPVYRQMLHIIQQAQSQARKNPRIDMPLAFEKPSCVIPGRFRQILPQPLPRKLPELSVRLNEKGVPLLSWPQSADRIGLIFQIYRGDKPDFPISEQTLVGQTELFQFADANAEPGNAYYALVLVSDPAQTCGTCKLGDCGHTDSRPIAQQPEQKSIDSRCPLATVAAKRSAPVYAPCIEVPELPNRNHKSENAIVDLKEVDFSDGFVTLPGEKELNPIDNLEISMDVRFDEPGNMPVVLDFGRWNGPGWFLQKLNGKWRFYIAGVNCDSSKDVPIGEWVNLKVVYKNGQVEIIQNGERVAKAPVPQPPQKWENPLILGQYETATPIYRFSGAVKNLIIRSTP